MNDPFYELYKDAGLVPIEIVLNGVLTSISLCGICLNSALVYITAKTKCLHDPCNILLALYAFFACFSLFGNSVKFFVFLFGLNYISLWHCFLVQCVPIAGATAAGILQLCIGLDRLTGSLCPIWYNQHGKYTVFKVLLCYCLIHTTIRSCIWYYRASLRWNTQVMCLLSDLSNQSAGSGTDYGWYLTLLIYFAEFGCYALIWTKIYCTNPEMSVNSKRLLHSLSILMTICLLCFILNTTFFYLIMPRLGLNPSTIEYVVLPVSFGSFLLAYSATLPILLWRSHQYRLAFRKCLCSP